MRRNWVCLVLVILVSLVLALTIVGCRRETTTPEDALVGHWSTGGGDYYFRDDGMCQWFGPAGPYLSHWSVTGTVSTNFPATLHLNFSALDEMDFLLVFAPGCESLEATDSSGSSQSWYYVDDETFEF